MEEENRLTRGMFGRMKGQVVIENNQDVPVMFMACLNPTMGYGGDVSGRTIALAPPAQGHITMIIIGIHFRFSVLLQDSGRCLSACLSSGLYCIVDNALVSKNEGKLAELQYPLV